MATVKIKYSDVIDRCKQLSAFEGQSLVSGDGSSRYKDIRLTDREEGLMKMYIGQGLSLIECTLGGSVAMQVEYKDMSGSMEDEDSDAELDMYGGEGEAIKEDGKGSFSKSVIETLTAYVMHMWLGDKVTERSLAYRNVFNEMLEATRRIAWKKKRPTMSD